MNDDKLPEKIAEQIAEKEAWSPRMVFWNTIGTVGGFFVGLVAALLFVYAVAFAPSGC